MVKCSKNMFLSKSNNALQYSRIVRAYCQHQAGLRNDTSCKLFSPDLRNWNHKKKVSHYLDCKSICTWRWISELSTSETLVEVNIKLVFTMTSCELASWESPNCGCTAVVIHNCSADLSTAIIFCSKCKGICFNFFSIVSWKEDNNGTISSIQFLLT